MALVTLPDLALNQATTETYFDSLNTDVNELIGRSGGNLLVNGGFEVWQRGAGPFAASTAYTADRWQLLFGGGTVTVTQEATTVDTGSAYALKVVNDAPVLSHRIVQKIERLSAIKGRTVALFLRVYQSVASGVRLSINGNAPYATSATTGAWVTLGVTVPLAAGVTIAEFFIEFVAAGTYYLDNAMLVVGPVPTEYVPEDPQVELARCQRYYEVQGGYNNAIVTRGIATAASQTFGNPMRFSVPKGGIPTVTKLGTWAVNNCGQPTINAVTTDGYELLGSSSAAGTCSFYCNSSDDRVEIVWNP